MQVKLLCSRSGPKISQRMGEVVTVTAKEGNRLIEKGMAARITPQKAKRAARRTRARKATAKADASK
ncbi:hypothetical protein [Pseudovibrio sp. POLY-S9]|uniref:hypothetical protein n=1 Tax=Pseudovibrio sp. POLY-S9 TaxID=1576596 RepID=UPI000AB28D59|nr:hypothetical protein [Pseudovibrio sp. POLY-S9]